MRNKHKTPPAETLSHRRSGRSAGAAGRRSVRELERIASNLRQAGETRVSESIDLRILALLEKKIYRKLMAKCRRERLSKGEAVA